MSRLRLRLLTAAVGVFVALFGSVVAASPAMAAESCYGDYCSGKWPQSAGGGNVPCESGARPVRSTDIYENGGEISIGGINIGLGGQRIGVIELWWSERCKTNWAELNLAVGANLRHMVIVQERGYYQYNELLPPLHYWLPAGVYYTPMIYSPVMHCQAYISKPPFWVSTLWA